MWRELDSSCYPFTNANVNSIQHSSRTSAAWRSPARLVILLLAVLVLILLAMPNERIRVLSATILGITDISATSPIEKGVKDSSLGRSTTDDGIFSTADHMPKRLSNITDGLGSEVQTFALYGGPETHIVILRPSCSAAYVRSEDPPYSSIRTDLTTAAVDQFMKFIANRNIDDLPSDVPPQEGIGTDDVVGHYGYLHYTSRERTKIRFWTASRDSDYNGPSHVPVGNEVIIDGFRRLHPTVKNWDTFGLD